MTSENVPAVVARYFSAIGEMDPDAWACLLYTSPSPRD